VGCLQMSQPVAPVMLPLLDRVALYLDKHDIAPTRFGKLAVGSPSLVNRMRAGKLLRRDTIERVEAMLAGPPVRMTQAQFKARRYRLALSEAVRADIAERTRRATDPHELAATFIRRRGWMVCRASVVEEGAEGFIVGSSPVTEDDLLKRARKYGWEG
jgi:hypothetical protein